MDYDATTFDAVLQDQFDTLDKLRGLDLVMILLKQLKFATGL